jgi:hypothetical protein
VNRGVEVIVAALEGVEISPRAIEALDYEHALAGLRKEGARREAS